MKKIALLTLLFMLGFAVTLVVVRWTGGRPAGEGSEEAAPLLSEGLSAAGDLSSLLETQLSGQVGGERTATLRLDESALRALLLVSLAGSSAGRRALDGTREMRVRIGDERLAVEVELDPSVVGGAAPTGGIDVAPVLGRLVELVTGRGLLVEVSGQPEVRDGALGLAVETTRIELNGLAVPISRLAEQLGSSAEAIERSLVLRIDGVHLERMHLEAGRLEMSGRVLADAS